MRHKIYNQDVIEWANTYTKGKFHALLSDPPYHLTTITKRFGKNGSAPAQYGTDGVFARSSAGFMGQTWDGGDVAFRPETWAALGKHLFPGAFGMAFSASRNWHRLAVAIEDAGFIIHPTIFGWLQGQGFPKATRVKGNETFEGHRYGLQALKPSVEPIIVFQKPYEGRPLDDIVSTGAGTLNIDAARIPVAENDRHEYGVDGDEPSHTGVNDYGEYHRVAYQQHEQGRWPANFILDDATALLLDEQTGNIKTNHIEKPVMCDEDANTWGGTFQRNRGARGYSDDGGASRFFYNVSNQMDDADPIFYCAKVSKKERNAGLDDSNGHPTVKPIDLAAYLAKLLLPPADYAPRRILVPFSGVGSEMIGCAKAGWEQIVGIEFDTENGYVDIAERRIEHWCR